ncbi:hypothetical protein CV944_16885 [Geobacillus sp. WSUCF-018B]|nr:hypothetical protein CV944_16885 [Geobacillus sp. WSUCF-018B]
MTEMPYLCWAFLYTSTGVNSYLVCNCIYEATESCLFYPFFCLLYFQLFIRVKKLSFIPPIPP